MGRRERPVDPAGGPVQRFAYELRKLRQEAGGPTYRRLAAHSAYSVTALSQAAAGERLPSLPVALAYAEACGGDAAEWERRWRQAAAEEAAQPPEDGAVQPPYRGLARFEPGDREWFFGRARLTADLVELVRGRRFAAVFGPSGSGKSSLLRAGLVPALQQLEEKPAALRVLTPGAHPARTHADLVTAAAGDGDTYLVVDQFEETFTLCQDPDERARFLDMLLSARDPAARLRVVVAVRADFYGRCAEHRELTEALAGAQLLVGPMSAAELREAVVRPAAAEGLIVERALTSRILKDVDGEPGALPLMSHVLLETWRRRRGRALTEEAYEAAGGVHGAIAATAEREYAGLSPAQQDAARRTLLRLVAPGEGAQDTRRPAPRAELGAGADGGPGDVDLVLERLTRARLLTADDDRVDLAHEALLTAWPRLRGWIEEDRERMRALRRLTEAAQGWEELERDPGALYRGSRLAQAEELFAGQRQYLRKLRARKTRGPRERQEVRGAQELTQTEAAFLRASTAARGRERRRLGGLFATLALLLVVALLAGAVAWQQDRAGDAEHTRAEARRIAAVAQGMRFSDPVRAMRLGVAAWALADTPESRGALLAAAHQREADSFALPQAEDPSAERFLSADGRTVTSVGEDRMERWDVAGHRRLDSAPGLGRPADETDFQVSPDGRTLAVAGDDGGVRLRPGPGRLPGGATMGWFGPSGHTYVASTWGFEESEPSTVQVWDLRTREKIFEHGADSAGQEWPTQVSPDDRLVALCTGSGPLEVWTTGERPERLRSYPRAPGACDAEIATFEFTPDSRGLVVMDGDGFRVLDVSTGRQRLEVEREGLSEIEFSQDGELVAAVGEDELVVWRTDDTEAPVLRHPLVSEYATELRLTPGNRALRYLSGFSGPVVRTVRLDGTAGTAWRERRLEGAVFSPDGSRLATARRSGRHGVFEVRDTRTGKVLAAPPRLRCRIDPVLDPVEDFCTPLMAFRPGGRVLAYSLPSVLGEAPERIELWDTAAGRRLPPLAVTPGSGMVNPLSSLVLGGSRSRSLVLSRIPERESIEIWDTRRGERTKRLRDVGGDVLALHPGGRLLATGDDQLVDLRSGRVRHRALTQDTVYALAFSADGRYLAAGDDSGRVTLWDGHGRRRLGVLPGTYRGLQTGGSEPATALAFSPDGSTLAVAGDRGTLRLWDTASNQPLGGPLPTSGDELLALSFSADGSRVYAVGSRTQPRAYPTAPERARVEVCARAGGGLSRDDWETYLPDVAYRETC